MYRHLDIDRILETVERLRRRIAERFPESNLRLVAAELRAVGEQARERVDRIRRPHWWLRALVGVAVALVGAAAIGAVWIALRMATGTPGVTEFLQGLDAAVNEILLVGAAVYFLFSFERRLKRREVLRALHELRSIAHVIDAHQLTKDPEGVLAPEFSPTASSPERRMTRHELARYLDYCSELLSLTAKLAAFHAQSDDDPVVLAAVNDVESLTGTLSNKIWQKMTIVESGVSKHETGA
jgi:hypothetical protein